MLLLLLLLVRLRSFHLDRSESETEGEAREALVDSISRISIFQAHKTFWILEEAMKLVPRRSLSHMFRLTVFPAKPALRCLHADVNT